MHDQYLNIGSRCKSLRAERRGPGGEEEEGMQEGARWSACGVGSETGYVCNNRRTGVKMMNNWKERR